jgi:very-short-patch-repair endonuclease
MDFLQALIALASRGGGLVSRADVATAGLDPRRLTDLVRQGVAARIALGVYAIGRALPGAIEPAAIARAWNVILSYESAAAWYGIDLPAPVDQLHVTAPRSRGRWADRVRGVRLHRAAVARSDIVLVRGTRLTSPLRTALDIARHRGVSEAVAIVDSFMRAGHFSQDEFVLAAACAQGPGRLRIQLVASLVDGASGSILESLTRVLLWRNDLPVPRSQFSFRSRRTGWVGYIDFAWPDQRVLLECDGYEYHSTKEPFQKDRRRWSAVSAERWWLGVVTWFDVVYDPTYVVALVRDLLDPESAPLNTNDAGVAFPRRFDGSSVA